MCQRRAVLNSQFLYFGFNLITKCANGFRGFFVHTDHGIVYITLRGRNCVDLFNIHGSVHPSMNQ